jgi:hypothetical protein
MFEELPFRFMLASALTIALAAAGCRGGSSNDGGGGDGAGDGQGGLSDATVLKCPYPGALPFQLESQGFQDDLNEGIASESTRSKDESSDTLGNPSGVNANTYVPVTEASAANPITYRGRKARTATDTGLSSFPLPGEYVSLWYYDSAAATWQTLGRAQTDGYGYYDIPPSMALDTALGQPVYAVLEADGSCAEHFDYLMPASQKVVITDIDGTLTLSDEELFKEIDDGSYDPLENQSASILMNKWHDKGYEIVYLTARPHNFRAETRAWMERHGFPTGAVVTANSLVFDDSAREYKRSWANRIKVDFKWEIVAAYGNATSDIDAYEDAGIPKDITFIVGEFAGASGTQAIQNNDYTAHIADFVDPYPKND